MSDTLKLINPGDDGIRSTTGEASEADMRRIYGGSLASGDPTAHTPGPDRRDDGFVHPTKLHAAQRARRQRRPDKFALRRLRDAFAISWPSAPEPVLAAQRTGLEAVSKAEEAARAIEALPDDRELEDARHAHAVTKAYDAAKPIPAPPATDWIAEDAVRRATFTHAVKAAEGALVAYRQVVEESKSEWRAALVKQVGPAWDEFVAAVRVVAKAGGRWSSAKAGAHRMSLDLGIFEPDTHRTSAPRATEPQAMAGIKALLALVDRDDVVLSGRYLAQNLDHGAVPEHTVEALRREAAHSPGGPAWARIAELDAAAKA